MSNESFFWTVVILLIFHGWLHQSIPAILSDALQLGTLIIATEVGDMPAIFRELNIGRTVPPQDPTKLADMLLECGGRDGATRGLSPGLRAPLTAPIESAKRFLRTVGLIQIVDGQEDSHIKITS